jgi:hypothetical protein
MTTKIYQCKDCHRDVDELDMWNELDGDYCVVCLAQKHSNQRDQYIHDLQVGMKRYFRGTI